MVFGKLIERKNVKIVEIAGGLGNQMFQYAFALHLKNVTNEEVKIDISFFDRHRCHNGYEIDTVFGQKLRKCSDKERKERSYVGSEFAQKLKRKLFDIKNTQYVEQGLPYNSNLDYQKEYFAGYWQSEKYFHAIKDGIKDFFTFSDPQDKTNIKLLKKIKKSDSVSIHVRRGDYVNHPLYGGICDIDYYKNAIEYIRTNIESPVVFIFSNDMQWCKENLHLSDANYIDWNQGADSFRDMQLMSECKHNIIANSSFSWWGAWLNKHSDKIVIAPSKWFNSEDMDARDIIPDGWIKTSTTREPLVASGTSRL